MQRLIGDIGGTNARFALVDENGLPAGARTLRVADYPGLVEAALRVPRRVGMSRRR